jgi:hypothetical protein
VETLFGKEDAEDTIRITPPPAGDIPGAFIKAVPVAGPDIYLAATIITPPPT